MAEEVQYETLMEALNIRIVTLEKRKSCGGNAGRWEE